MMMQHEQKADMTYRVSLQDEVQGQQSLLRMLTGSTKLNQIPKHF
jgi:hypothetical protein